MKKYLIIIFVLFLLISIPVFASSFPTTANVTNTPIQQNNNNINNKTVIVTPIFKKSIITPVIKQEKKQDIQLKKEVDENSTKISNQVTELVKDVGINGNVVEKVKEITQTQIKIQDEIKTDLKKLDSRPPLIKLIIGSNKKVISSIKQKIDQNNSNIKKLEELKSITKNQENVKKIQESIKLISNQNNLLQTKINLENKKKGLFGWLINLFNKN